MSTTPIWLTDEDADIFGYKRAKIGSTTQPNRSDTPSLVRAVTATQAGPATIPMLRMVGSRSWTLGWITDPLNAPNLSSGAWAAHLWAFQDSVLANCGLKLDVLRWTSSEGGSVVSATSGALPTGVGDVTFTSGAASSVQLEIGDRLVIKVSLVDVGGVMAAGHSVSISYNGLYGRAEGDTYVICPDELGVPNDIPDDDVLAVRTVLRDASSMNPQMSDDEIIRFIRQALMTYSVDRPRQVAYYYSGDGVTFNFPLPPKWVWGGSRIVAMEYPADAEIPSTMDQIDWELREGVLGVQPIRYLRFKTIIPDNTANNAWILYTTRHEYSSEYSTVPVADFDAVLWLAGSYCASALASRGAGATDSSLSADAINYRDMEIRWGSVAKRLKDLYLNRVVNPDSATPVGTTEEWKPILETGQNFLWHSRRVRRTR